MPAPHHPQQSTEPVESVPSGPATTRRVSETDDFGEEVPRDLGPVGRSVGGQDKWHVESQLPFQLGADRCMLTIFQNSVDRLLRFEALKLDNAETLYVTCTDAYFDQLCAEQVGLVGPAKINSATQELFRQAMAEYETPATEAATEQGEVKDLCEQDRRSSLTSDLGEDSGSIGQVRRKSVTDDFGEDQDSVEAMAATHKLMQRRLSSNEERWYVQSQEAFQLQSENCTLTILSNDTKGLLRFELLKLQTAETLYITCTVEQFDSLCDEQSGPTGPAKVNAAIRQLFREFCSSHGI